MEWTFPTFGQDVSFKSRSSPSSPLPGSPILARAQVSRKDFFPRRGVPFKDHSSGAGSSSSLGKKRKLKIVHFEKAQLWEGAEGVSPMRPTIWAFRIPLSLAKVPTRRDNSRLREPFQQSNPSEPKKAWTVCVEGPRAIFFFRIFRIENMFLAAETNQAD